MRKNAKDGREAALKEQQKIEEDVVSTGTLLGGGGTKDGWWATCNSSFHSLTAPSAAPLLFVPIFLVTGGLSQATK